VHASHLLTRVECPDCPHLQALDLEGNCIADNHTVEWLSLTKRLQSLTLLENPIALQADYATDVSMVFMTALHKHGSWLVARLAYRWWWHDCVLAIVQCSCAVICLSFRLR
jgi:hypothetical protein